MRDHEIDQILAGDPEIIPSPRFKARVMSAVRTNAAAPPPLPFPWAIALPGPVLSVVAMAWCVVDAGDQTRPQPPLYQSLLKRVLADSAAIAQAAHVYALDWLLLSFFLVWISWKLTARLTGVKP